MAQFSYDAYAAQQEARRSARENSNGNMGPRAQYLNAYLKNDGDVAVVRFPYRSMSDIQFESTHSVTFPGKKFPSRVRCAGQNCPLCADGNATNIRFFAKALVYSVNETGTVELVNGVWDRPSAFADIDIKNLMQEYGDLTQHLFKIKRNGEGTNTRYTISIITNTTVYNPAVYKADFTELDQIDATKILTRSIEQYTKALSGESAPSIAPSASAAAYTAPTVETHLPTSIAQNVNPSAAPAAAPAATPAAEPRRQTRYTF